MLKANLLGPVHSFKRTTVFSPSRESAAYELAKFHRRQAVDKRTHAKLKARETFCFQIADMNYAASHLPEQALYLFLFGLRGKGADLDHVNVFEAGDTIAKPTIANYRH
jgi:hypothetical protein